MNLDFDIPCPGCGHQFKQPASNLKPGGSCVCPSCGKTIEFTGDDASAIERDLTRSIEDVRKAFRKIGK